MNNMTLLTEEQIDNSEIFEKYGIGCACTDFAILMGAYVCTDVNNYHTKEGKNIENRVGEYWTRTKYLNLGFATIWRDGKGWSYIDKRSSLIRPVMSYSKVAAQTKTFTGINGVKMLYYGEYPMWATTVRESKKIEKQYRKNKLSKTGRIYTVDLWATRYRKIDLGFKEKQYEEYEYEDKKYIRVCECSGEYETLSSGYRKCDYKVCWIKVEPVLWLVDEENDIIVSKDGIVSGIQLHYRNMTEDLEFDQTLMKWYLDNYLSKELIQNLDIQYSKEEENEINIPTKEKKMSEKLLELFVAFKALERDVNDEYLRKQTEMNDIWEDLINITMQSNEVSDEQLTKVKKRIKNLK